MAGPGPGDAGPRGGGEIRRARIVSEPVSDYIRFEHHLTAGNIRAGEQVRWLPRRRASKLALPGNDFWPFDSRLLMKFVFDDDRTLGVELSDAQAEVLAACEARDVAWHHAVRTEDFTRRIRSTA